MAYTVIEYEASETIFRQGDAGNVMYMVKDGEVEVIQEMAGHDHQVAVLERGDFFGEMAMLEHEPRTHSVRALSLTKVVRIDRQGLHAMLLRNPEIGVRMIRKLNRRLLATEDMLLRAFAGAGMAERHGKAAEGSSPAYFRNTTEGLEFEIPAAPQSTIGRADPNNDIEPDIDLTTIDAQLSTSRRHALMMRRDERFFLMEEKATNGTYLNGQRISSESPIEIRSGDDIMFGAVRLRFVVGDAPQSVGSAGS